MCSFSDIDKLTLSNGKTVKEANSEAKQEIERIYRDCWAKGVSVPFWDQEGNIYLANPDGSEDKVILDVATRTYKVVKRIAMAGCGRYAYLV